jgi:arginyl-tRNA synthetase
VTRFVMLTRRNDMPLDFDFDKVTEASKDNPVWYVQYAHARIASVLRKAAEAGADTADATLARADLATLDDPAQLALIRRLADWPRQVALAARHHEPHRVAFFLYDLAAEFHALYKRGDDLPGLRFLDPGRPDAQAAKIALARATGVVIANGLAILGVTPVEEMR